VLLCLARAALYVVVSERLRSARSSVMDSTLITLLVLQVADELAAARAASASALVELAACTKSGTKRNFAVRCHALSLRPCRHTASRQSAQYAFRSQKTD
jgi:hypothetical protein